MSDFILTFFNKHFQPGLRPVVTELVSSARQLYEDSCELLRDKAHNLVSLIDQSIEDRYDDFLLQRLREDLETKLSASLAGMEQELRKCVFDESGTGLVYLHQLQPEDQVIFHHPIYFFLFLIILIHVLHTVFYH